MDCQSPNVLLAVQANRDSAIVLEYASHNRSAVEARRNLASTLAVALLAISITLFLLASKLSKPHICTRTSEARSEVGPSSLLSQSIEGFQLDTGRWPATLKELIDKPADEKELPKWPAGGYLRSNSELNDPWGNEFKYAAGSKATHNKGMFDLWSCGPDGVSGTADDIGNWPAPKK